MDNCGEGVPHDDGQNGEVLSISDVFEAIDLADPSFGAMAQPQRPPYMQIIEQPASKALRFRYECEGRSAGSIPGCNSTSENKTYPTIKILNYVGPVVIVVSCVTKDEPYKPHPHNLVGRERCNRGVCTIPTRITEESNEYQFRNLGIQCVKRRDIAEALRIRQELRVDPYRTGFGHMEHPQSIDLNAVRLCFQVFLPDAAGRCRRPLAPVVSDIIYDKKAMSDLLIMRASHCSGTARGGTQVILLCEKVTREDTAVVFFLEVNNEVVWEEVANTIVVHKQVAIAFETPPFRDPHTSEHVTVRFQLKRVTDNTRSNSLPFEYIPDYPGTARKPLPDLSIFSLLLNEKRTDSNNNKADKAEVVSSTTDTVSANVSDESGSATITDVNGNLPIADPIDTNEKSLNELLDQVAELDEIYSENRTRLENITSLNSDSVDIEDFNDAGTYTSLQLAFRNPVEISEPDPMSYEDVQVQTFRGPIIEFSPLKRDTDDERAPPLPPKRVRKAASTEPFKTSQTSVDSILKPGRQLPVTRNLEVMRVTEKPLSVAKSEPALPPVKKRSFFSRLFRRKEKSPAPSVKSEGRKDSRKSKPVGRSVSSVSGQRPSKFKSSVSHTSLKDNASDVRYKRKKVSSLLQTYDTEKALYGDHKIKSEPKTDKTPPYLPQYGEWQMGENIQQGLAMTGGSNMPFNQEMWAGPGASYVQHPSPSMHPASPPMQMQNLQVLTSNSPHLQQMPMSPNMQVLSPHAHASAMSPHGQALSPHGQAMSPHGPAMSPHGAAMSPHGSTMPNHGQIMSPNLQVLSPQHMGRVSPNMQHPQQNMGHISPNLVQQVPQQPTYVQMQPNLMETDMNSTPSLSNLLMGDGRGEMLQLNSGELSGLSSLLGDSACQ